MMVVVALVAILAAIAAPNLSDLFINNRLSTTANELLAVLNTARSEAIRRGTVVSIRRCDAVNSANGCAEASSGAQDWTKGWYVFVDVDAFVNPAGRGKRDVDQEELLRVGQAVAEPLSVFQGMNGGAAPDTSVSFCPDGRLLGLGSVCGGGGSNSPTIFVVCYEGKLAEGSRSRSRAILVNSQGQVRLAPQGSTGLPLNEDETPLDKSVLRSAPDYAEKGCEQPKFRG
jgi:type IV fimbrial biogenesis protein FimT